MGASRSSIIAAMTWEERIVTAGAKKLTAYTRLPHYLHERVVRSLMRQFDEACVYCGDQVFYPHAPAGMAGKFATIDHRLPLSKGGTWKRRNLALACRDCNTEKGDTAYCEFRPARPVTKTEGENHG